MKEKIHPTYYDKTTITCACGQVVDTGSTKKALRVEICSACHPFFTGKQKFIDSGGRVERFKKRFVKSQDTSEPVSQETSDAVSQ